MGFHGYGGHTSCIIGGCSIADCPGGPQPHYHSHGSSSYNHNHGHLHPNRTIVPRHRNDGPVDLSQYCTPTGRGTWSIGGQRTAPQASPHVQIQGPLNHYVTRSQHTLAPALCPTTRANSPDDTTPFNHARLCQSTLHVDIPKLIADDKDAKNDRNTGDAEKTEKTELEKEAAALLDLVRAMAFPIPVYHEHSHICTDTATVLGARNASAFSPSTVSSYQANCDSKGWYGVYAIGSTAYPISEQRPGISNISSS
jgi:hypothetical protein